MIAEVRDAAAPFGFLYEADDRFPVHHAANVQVIDLLGIDDRDAAWPMLESWKSTEKLWVA